MIETKLGKLKTMWSSGDFAGAIKLAASFPRLGDEKEPITRAWAAMQNPEFYRSIGQDPDSLFEEGKAAIARRYDL